MKDDRDDVRENGTNGEDRKGKSTIEQAKTKNSLTNCHKLP